MEFRILGPLGVYERGAEIPLGKPQERAVLAVLLLHANQPLSRERLVDLVWGDSPPRTANAAVYNYVSRLRRALGSDRLSRRGAAYELLVGEGELDRDRFQSLVALGEAALEAGEAERAAGVFREALALWRGEALNDVRYESFAQAEIYRLEELRLATLERQIDAELELGLHAALVAELESVAREHPLRERFRAQLMLALYRSGRQADALDVYRRTRSLLVGELGIEPGPALQELERAILRQERSLAASGSTAAREAVMRAPAGDLPTGTVTLLVTDIEGATRLLLELGERASVGVLEQHRRTLRDAFARHGGVEVDATDDGFFVAFARAADAVAYAADAQQALTALPVRVRMGMHTGEPQLTDAGYTGVDLDVAAGICRAGHGGQVLVSETTSRLVEAELRDLGLHRLTGLGRSMRLYQLGEGEFPPTVGLSRTNLPAHPAPLVGRRHEVGEITELVRSGVRLVTLTGPGGIGKTRLALQAATELVEDFVDGVCWVSLAAVRESARMLAAVEESVGARDGLIGQIGDKRMLLVLDNFEQLLTATPALADLLARCVSLHLCVTSRALLRIAGEHAYSVPVLAEEDAVALFSVRANVDAPDEAAEICRRLDNLPLAIELAAARTRVLSPAQLLARLEPRLPLLRGGARDVPERQRTLNATIRWSYDLLTPAERRLFARLAVFAGGFTLEAAEEICEADLDTIQALVEQSLLQLTEERFVMLETIREYARSRPIEGAESESVARRHAEWVLARGVPFAHDLGSTQLQLALPELRAEVHNARAAIAWALEHAEPEFVLRLILASWAFGPTFADAAQWYDKALPRADPQASQTLAHALRDAGGVAEARGDSEKATRLLAKSLAMYRELRDEDGETRVLRRLGDNALATGDLQRAGAVYDESRVLAERRADVRGTYMALAGLGRVEHRLGNTDRGAELLEQSVALARAEGDLHAVGTILQDVADAALDARSLSRARTRYQEAMSIASRIWHDQLTAYCLAGLAATAALDGDAEDAGRLWAMLGALEASSGGWLANGDRARYEQLVNIGAADAQEAFERGSAAGLAMTPEEATRQSRVGEDCNERRLAPS